jgi:hypothetical protein
MYRLVIPVLMVSMSVFSLLDTAGLSNNTWVNLVPASDPFSINSGNWAYENDFQSHPFYGFFVMGPGHRIWPQDSKFYPYDPIRNQWWITEPPRLPERRCMASFAVNSQDSAIIQVGGSPAGHNQGQGAWTGTYASIDLGGKRHGMWAYSFNRNRWYHMDGPVFEAAYMSHPTPVYDPVHDLVITPYNDTTYLYNFHTNHLKKIRNPATFRMRYISCAVDRRRGIAYLLWNNTFYKFDPDTEQWTQVSGTTPPCPQGSSDGNETGLNQMAYDEVNDVLIYTGDDNTSGGSPNISTWIYDCANLNWTKMSTGTAPLDRGRLAYNRALNVCLLLGGTANSWISRGGSTKGIWAYRYQRGPSTLAAAPDAVINTTGSTPLLQWRTVSGVSGYNIYRGTATIFPKNFQKLNTSIVTDTFYQDASFTAGTPHVYRICAVKSSVEGEFSRLLYARPARVLGATASVENPNTLRLTWEPGLPGTVTGYNVYRAVGAAVYTPPFPGSFVKRNSTPITTNEYVDTIAGAAGFRGIVKGFVVTAVNGLGLESGVSSECTSFPECPDRVFVVQSGSQMVLHWQPPRWTNIQGVFLYHIHPHEDQQPPGSITVATQGSQYWWQPGEYGQTYATLVNGGTPITDTVTQWPMPPSPSGPYGYYLQTKTYYVRSLSSLNQQGWASDQISPNFPEYGSGIISAGQRFNYAAWSPIYSGVQDAPVLPNGASDKLSVRPNPFIPGAQVVFRAQAEKADIRIIDIRGKVVLSRTVRTRQGYNTIPFNLSGKPSGVYIVEVRKGKERLTTRATLIR